MVKRDYDVNGVNHIMQVKDSYPVANKLRGLRQIQCMTVLDAAPLKLAA
jgi:hypothetical protein